jgi:Holliday junction resolvase RusA-like endonuclease
MRRQELEILKKNLIDNGFTIKAFGLVRSPYSFACSALQQTIKNGKFHSFIGLGDAYLFHTSQQNKYYLPERSQQIERLLDIFKDDLQLYSFKQATSHADGPVSFLLSQIKPSLSSRMKENFKSSTPSLTNLQARLMNAINALNKLQTNEKISKQLIEAQRLAIHKQTGQTTGEKFFLTEQEFKLVESHYNKISQRMEKALGRTFIEESIRFSKPNIDPTYIAQALTAYISSFVVV